MSSVESATSSPEKRKRLHLWSSRRLSGLKRTMSSPIPRVDLEGSPKALDDVDVHENEEEQGDASSLNNVAREEGLWSDDAESNGTAFKDDALKFESEGEWAQNLFYAYVRRTDDPRFSRFLVTFSSARICAEWWSLIQHHFGGSPTNTREGAQFFSFAGDDIPGRAWKHQSFRHLRTKWMYSQLGDAVGAMGKGQEIIPLQDERGFLLGASQGRTDNDRAPSRAGSIADSLGNRELMSKNLRRASKRDSGILLPSSPLINHERSHSVPLLPPESAAGPQQSDKPSTFDFDRMEQNLSRIEKMMSANASQLRSLEHVQAANLERLTAALLSNAEMIRSLGDGQKKLGDACEDLRRVVRERDERSERMSLVSRTSTGSVPGACGHSGKKGPRKIGRKVVGYIYADELGGEGTKTIVPATDA